MLAGVPLFWLRANLLHRCTGKQGGRGLRGIPKRMGQHFEFYHKHAYYGGVLRPIAIFEDGPGDIWEPPAHKLLAVRPKGACWWFPCVTRAKAQPSSRHGAPRVSPERGRSLRDGKPPAANHTEGPPETTGSESVYEGEGRAHYSLKRHGR